MQFDTKYYKLFKELKQKYTPLMVYITEDEVFMAPKDPKDPMGFHLFIARKFRDQHRVGITRFRHDYNTDKLGLVFLAGDSDINRGYEVWALMGYNATAIERMEDANS